MSKRTAVNAASLASKSGSGYPEPFNTIVGTSSWHALGEHFDLTQFGVNLEVIKPGDQSALRHWHTLSDEFVYVLAGAATLVTDAGESVLTAGMCVGFKAGVRDGHHFINRSAAEAQLLVLGARIPGDTAFYPDDDLAWLPTEDGKRAVRKNGQAYS
jgi:uncharacterized cupin superfamily protein